MEVRGTKGLCFTLMSEFSAICCNSGSERRSRGKDLAVKTECVARFSTRPHTPAAISKLNCPRALGALITRRMQCASVSPQSRPYGVPGWEQAARANMGIMRVKRRISYRITSSSRLSKQFSFLSMQAMQTYSSGITLFMVVSFCRYNTTTLRR